MTIICSGLSGVKHFGTMRHMMTLASLLGAEAPATLSVEQTAEVLHIGRGSAYEAVRTGQIPALKIGGRVLVPVPALLRVLGAELDGEGTDLGASGITVGLRSAKEAG